MNPAQESPVEPDRGAAEIECPNCSANWELNESEAAHSFFTCPDCQTVIPLGLPQADLKRTGFLGLEKFLPRSRAKWVFVVVMAAYVTVSETLVQDLMGPFVTTSGHSFYTTFGWGKVLVTAGEWAIFGPIWESLLLIVLVESVRAISRPVIAQIVIPTIGLAMVDGYGWWPHGLEVAPGFLIFVLSYLYWRPASRRVALAMVILIHTTANMPPTVRLLLGEAHRQNTSIHETGLPNSWDRAEALYNDGNGLLYAGKFAEAAKSFEQAIAIYPSDADYHVSLGCAYDKMLQAQKAEIEYHRAIALDQYNWRAWGFLANSLYSQGRYSDAVDAARHERLTAPPSMQSVLKNWVDSINLQISGTSKSMPSSSGTK